MFIPTTPEEVIKLGWQKLDVILVTGDTYIDSPYIGISVIGKTLINAGYRVGIIAQPDIKSDSDITRLGEPELFWGISAGSVDSMVANYTASRKKRKQDDFTPGGENTRRPDRAVISYCNLIRQYYKNTKPLVIGGIEASLRRIAHYDFWSNKVRKSILFDAKADILVYGMGEKATLELADKFNNNEDYSNLRGICFISKDKREGFLDLPDFDISAKDKNAFVKMFNLFYENNDPITAKGLQQKYDARYLIQNPPAHYLSDVELDKIHDLDFERDTHPHYKRQGEVRALNTIRFSIPSHRGCYGECNFCAIAVHQGRTVRSRSQKSIIAEAETIANYRDFKGNILDVGGPTANMYGFECSKKLKSGCCTDKRCLFPSTCKALKPDHSEQLELLKKLKDIKGVKKIFIASGLRYDLILNDQKNGHKYFEKIIEDHISGQLKIAPEHADPEILALMGKPNVKDLIKFKGEFEKINREKNKKQFLTYYFIAAHPGCEEKNMTELKNYVTSNLKLNPEQVQIFTPTPSTYSTLMYYTEMDPFSGKKIFVEKEQSKKDKQKNLLTLSHHKNKKHNFKKRNK